MLDAIDQQQKLTVRADSREEAEQAFRELVARAFPGTLWELESLGERITLTGQVVELHYARVSHPQLGEPQRLKPWERVQVSRDSITRPAAKLAREREELAAGGGGGWIFVAQEQAEEAWTYIPPVLEPRVDDEQDELAGLDPEKLAAALEREREDNLEEIAEEDLAEEPRPIPGLVEWLAREAKANHDARLAGLKPLGNMTADERLAWERRRLEIAGMAEKVFSRPSPATKTVWRTWVVVTFWLAIAALSAGTLGFAASFAARKLAPISISFTREAR